MVANGNINCVLSPLVVGFRALSAVVNEKDSPPVRNSLRHSFVGPNLEPLETTTWPNTQIPEPRPGMAGL